MSAESESVRLIRFILHRLWQVGASLFPDKGRGRRRVVLPSAAYSALGPRQTPIHVHVHGYGFRV